MDLAIDYLVDLWGSLLYNLDRLFIIEGVSVLGILVGMIVILIVITGVFGGQN